MSQYVAQLYPNTQNILLLLSRLITQDGFYDRRNGCKPCDCVIENTIGFDRRCDAVTGTKLVGFLNKSAIVKSDILKYINSRFTLTLDPE